MKFNLLFPNVVRQRLLLAVTIAWLGGAIGLAAKLDEPIGFGLMIAYPIIAFIWSCFPKLANRVFWCPFWAVVATDGVAWQKTEDRPLARYEFADTAAYRFASNKGSTLLILRLRNGERIKLECRYTQDFASFQQTFEQAIRGYNQANPEASIAAERGTMARFFTSRASTCVLVGILVVDMLSVVRGARVEAPSGLYAPLVLSFPYLIAWLAHLGQRT